MAADEREEEEVEGAGEAITREAEPSTMDEACACETLMVTTIDPGAIAADEEPLELDPRTGVPKVLRAYVVHADPRISVVPNFLGPGEIDHLLELCEEHWVPSTVGSGVYKTNDETKDLQNKASPNRTSYSCMLRSEQTSVVHSIEQRLARLAGLDVAYLERLNMVRYAPGQLFNKHHDGRFRPKTVFIYLNDLADDGGGETLFPELGLQFRPRKGCAVMWSNVLSPGREDHRTVHQGLPPRHGMKYGVNCFFNDKPLKEWEDTGDLEAHHVIDPAEFQVEYAEEGGGSAPPLKPGQIRAFCVCQEPKVTIVPGFLSQGEAEALAAMVEPSEEQRAGAEDILSGIEQRIAVIAGLPLACMDALRVGKCGPEMTPDGQVTARSHYSERFGTKVVYMFLNDVQGGELRFPKLGLQVRPRAGTAVVWPIVMADGRDDLRAVHQGRPPKTGLRYTAIAVFRDGLARPAVQT